MNYKLRIYGAAHGYYMWSVGVAAPYNYCLSEASINNSSFVTRHS